MRLLEAERALHNGDAGPRQDLAASGRLSEFALPFCADITLGVAAVS